MKSAVHDTQTAMIEPYPPERINDFALKFANVNGTGSASANNMILKSIFRMGVPVSGKNLFPSNIQGLPTWFEIRANEAGHTSRASSYDLVVAMNGQTYADDIAEVRPGGYVLHDSSWPLAADLHREDIKFLGIPLAQICAENFSESRVQILMKNVAYAGAVAALVSIEFEVLAKIVEESFPNNQRLRESNAAALGLGYNYAQEHFQCPLPFRSQRADLTSGKILIDGNTAAALGCVYAGATIAAWYPITPATSLAENFRRLCERYRHEEVAGEGTSPELRKNYLILQAEDELAAIGMVIGASWAGARAFTSTSGPGISLMNELLGLAYYTEIPAVVFDVQRSGPSTGMPTRIQQADLLTCAYASHGDTKHILLIPGDPAECFDFAVAAFDLAEHFQTPVIVLSDLDIGMNDWVVPALTWDESYRPDRGPVLNAKQREAAGEFHRYSNENSDFVAPRTLPGTDSKGAYFTRGSGHDRFGLYTEDPSAYQQVVDRLARKHAASASKVPPAVIATRPEAPFGVVTLGSCEPAVLEALAVLDLDGLPIDYMRIRGFPFGTEVRSFIDNHEFCFVVEQNRDAQLRTLLVAEAGINPIKLRSILSYGGLPLGTDQVIDGIKEGLKDS